MIAGHRLQRLRIPGTKTCGREGFGKDCSTQYEAYQVVNSCSFKKLTILLRNRSGLMVYGIHAEMPQRCTEEYKSERKTICAFVLFCGWENLQRRAHFKR
jgi:hypothetical protein